MLSYDHEQRIRAEEKIRVDEHEKIIQNQIDQRQRALREEDELQYLREVSQVHGIGAAYLIRMTPFLIGGAVVGLLASIGSFTSASESLSFFTKLWEAIKDCGTGFGVVALYGLWRCRNI